jgi:membrane protease YdiL (CAAX protease family)
VSSFVISYILNRKVIPEYLYLKGRKRDSFIRGSLFGIVFFAIFMITYFFLKKYLDLNSISKQINQDYQITTANFILIGLHLTFFNSFIEEFFYRGFIFFNLYNSGYKKTAFIYSSVLFGVYHIIIFWGWFSMPIFFLALFALIAVGFLFSWMNVKSKNLYNSWTAHLCADIPVFIIGLIMLKMI